MSEPRERAGEPLAPFGLVDRRAKRDLSKRNDDARLYKIVSRLQPRATVGKFVRCWLIVRRCAMGRRRDRAASKFQTVVRRVPVGLIPESGFVQCSINPFTAAI